MSHLSKVQVAIRDIDVLGEALKALGLRRVKDVPENYEFADTFNTCDVIAANAVNRVMAFKFVDGEAELHTNLEPGDFEKTRDELLQKYAVLLLRKTVEQEGKFQVQEQETPAGRHRSHQSRKVGVTDGRTNRDLSHRQGRQDHRGGKRRQGRRLPGACP